MAIGETGTLRTNSTGRDDTFRVEFSEDIPNAVIHLTSTNRGGQEFNIRVTSVDEKGFEFQLEEFENHDGSHTTETFNWIAVKPGVHTLPDGRVIEAGFTTATHADSDVKLEGSFEKPPVVLTNVMSENGKDSTDSDPDNVTTKGFTVSLEEGALSDGISTGELVGYIAIGQGGDGSAGSALVADGLSTSFQTFDLGVPTKGGLVFGETQTSNDTGAGNVHLNHNAPNDGQTASLMFDEDTGDGNKDHAVETVGIAIFAEGTIPCFTPGALIDTEAGPRAVETLTPGTLLRTRSNGAQPLLWRAEITLSAEALRARPALAPIRIRAHAFGPGQPARDLLVSPQHRILIRGARAQVCFGRSEVLAPACGLVNGTTITRAAPAPVTYIHLLCRQHEVLCGDGLWSESLLARELALEHSTPATRAALFGIFPDLAAMGQAQGQAARLCVTRKEARVLMPA